MAELDRAADAKKPYGDVSYADPGYQKDGKKRYPLDNEAHCRAAWSYINMPKNAAKYSAEQVSKIKGRIKSAGKKYGIDFSDDTKRAEPEVTQQKDLETAQRAEPIPYARSWALEDIQIMRAADGYADGRTVTAYAAVFDTPTEVTDQHGHYNEVIARTAFNRQIGLGIDRVGVFYHHALTLHGTPSELGSVPIGSPLDIRADNKGLRTVTRFNRTPLGDSVLEAIRAGDIKGYSFRGRIYKSNPERLPRRRRTDGPLPTVTRLELGLTEYGPTPTPAYADAGVLAIRALQELAEKSVFAASASTTPAMDEETPPATPDPGPGDAEDQPEGHSRRQQQLIRLRRAMRDRGLSQ